MMGRVISDLSFGHPNICRVVPRVPILVSNTLVLGE
jgi:hypothetical protein